MRAINRKLGTTFIFSTHDQKVIDVADRLIGIEDGRVRFLGLKKDGKWLITDDRRRAAPAAEAETR
jgi:putative ABC transport system ATP-binding protein